MSGIDLNRAGTPLLEIVTEPDMRSAAEAVAYARTLHGLVRWLDICDGNMQEGSFRCDANVSVRPAGETTLGTRTEIKNLNSFRFLERAIEYEARRQIDVLEDGGRIVQETRLYDPDRGETRSMRTKEEAHDYRYFPDPDLLPLVVTEQWIEDVRATLPELPEAKRNRYLQDFGLSSYDVITLTQSRETATFYEDVVASLRARFPAAPVAELAKLAANWVTVELAAALNRADLDIAHSRVAATALAALPGCATTPCPSRSGRRSSTRCGRVRASRTQSSRSAGSSRFPMPARSRRSSAKSSRAIRRRSPNTAPGARRLSTFSSARR
jgi:aspartyl-tRNA(Asn)/glutamyl-tRNA(Gln) amidotransferase subunit B